MTKAPRIFWFAGLAAALLLLTSDRTAAQTGSSVVTTFVVDSGTGMGIGNAIAVDSKNVHIAYYSRATATGVPPLVKYETFPLDLVALPAAQTVDILTTNPSLIPPQAISIAIDSQGMPHIVYQDGQGGLKYAYIQNGIWTTEVIAASGAGSYNALALDKSDAPHVAFGGLSYATRSAGPTGVVWNTEIISSVKTLTGVSMVVDSQGQPRVAWSQHAPNDAVVYAARGTGLWTEEIVSSVDSPWISLAIDATDTPSVSYWGWNGGSGALSAEVDYSTRMASGSTAFWQPTVVDTINIPCCQPNPFDFNQVALSLSPTGDPRISYGSEVGVKFAKEANGAFTNQVIDPQPADGFTFTSLAVDNTDSAHILFRSASLNVCPTAANCLVYQKVAGPNTPVGFNVSVNPADSTTGTNPVTITFGQVTQAGTTSLVSGGAGFASPPQGFQLGNPPVAYDISTTALYLPPVTVCIQYGNNFVNPANLSLMHYEGGSWVDRTISNDTTQRIICGTTSSLSPFAVFEKQVTQPTPLTITANNGTRLYGSPDPAFSVSYAGFINGDGPSVLSGALSCASNSNAASSVGAYTITCSGLTSNSYSIVFVPGVLTITPAPLTIAANNATRLYGANNPAFIVSYTGFVSGDTPAALSGALSCSSTATPSSSVGPYAIACGGLTSSNYAISFLPGTLSVTPASLTVTANSASRPYGATNPVVLPTILGVANADPISAIDSTSATPASPVGAYAITPVLSDPSNRLSNYTLSILNGTLTVVPEATSLTVTLSPTSIVVGQSSTATVTLTGPDMAIPIDPSALAGITLTSSVATDVLSNAGTCTPTPGSANGTANCVFTVTSTEPNGRTLTASFAGSADLAASTGTAQLIVTEPVQGRQSCIASDFRNVAVAGGNYIWFNSIFRIRDVSKQTVHISFSNSTVQFQYTDASGNVVPVNLAIPNAQITIDPGVTVATTSYDPVNNVWNTTLPWDLDDNAFLSGMPWLVPAAGLPADVEPVNWCGTFAVDVSGAHIGWRWAAATYSSFGSDGTVLGVKPINSDDDNPATNHDRAGTPENFKQFVIPGARGKGGSNYTGSYSRSTQIE